MLEDGGLAADADVLAAVGRILVPVARRLYQSRDGLDCLRRIGIDEIAYKKRHRYLVVVVDHDRKRLVWAAEGRDEKTVDRFFFELGPERCALIIHSITPFGSDGQSVSSDTQGLRHCGRPLGMPPDGGPTSSLREGLPLAPGPRKLSQLFEGLAAENAMDEPVHQPRAPRR